MTTRITKRLVDSAEPATKYYFLWDAGDGAVKGFGLKVNPNGQKVFVAQFRIGSGRAATSRRVTIGTYGAWTVERARDAARELIRSGNDGIDLRAAEDEAIKAELARREAEIEKEKLYSRFVLMLMLPWRPRGSIVMLGGHEGR